MEEIREGEPVDPTAPADAGADPAPSSGAAASSSAGPADGAGPGDSQQTEQIARHSRALLSKATTVPEWLTDRYKIPTDIVVTHVQHKSKLLPHFQARLPGDMKYEGKSLVDQICSVMFLNTHEQTHT